jgi:hypothetical protein
MLVRSSSKTTLFQLLAFTPGRNHEDNLATDVSVLKIAYKSTKTVI